MLSSIAKFGEVIKARMLQLNNGKGYCVKSSALLIYLDLCLSMVQSLIKDDLQTKHQGERHNVLIR
jgi:hypothetical protein